MAGYLERNWKMLYIFAIVYCSFIKTSISETIENKDETKIRNVTKECILLNNHDIYVAESIERSDLYKLQIYGAVISFTDIPDDSFCPGDVVIIEMFAAEKIIIDDDYDALGDSVTFILAAPTWEIVGKRRINLRGHDASEHEKPSADNGRHDSNRNGSNGRAGHPGGPGGDFHGIAWDVNNMENLDVSVQGGNGGLPGIYAFLNLRNEECDRNIIFKDVESGKKGRDGKEGKSVEGEEILKEHPHWQNFLFTLDRFRGFLLTKKDLALNVSKIDIVIHNINRVMNNVRCILLLIES